MNRRERRAARKPITTDDARWAKAAKDMIAGYDGDTERLVMELLISHEVQVQQVEYLQGEIERIAKAVPGLVTIRYEPPGTMKPATGLVQ